MDISLKSIILLGSVILTGLSAGFFYAWSVSVIPGNKRVTDLTYLDTMQSINKAILNPAFFLVFFGITLGTSIVLIKSENNEPESCYKDNALAIGCSDAFSFEHHAENNTV